MFVGFLPYQYTLFLLVIFIPVTSINADEGASMSLGESVMVSLFSPTDLYAPVVLLRPSVLVMPHCDAVYGVRYQ